VVTAWHAGSQPGPVSPAEAEGDPVSTDPLRPRDHAEEIALFRAEIVGSLVRRELSRGELAAEIALLAQVRYRPPGSRATKCYGASTIERWYYAYKRDGLEGLKPDARSDRGRARELLPEQRALLLDIRREHPGASVPLILRTLILDGRLAKGAVSVSTVTRLYREAKLPRGVRPDGHTRLRWQADHPGALFHGDVCHGPSLRIGQTTKPLRIHALLDDASRFVVALEAHHTEREDDMLGLFLGVLRRHGRPDALYLDNGSTYRGEALRIACERLDITLLHARPYDAPARGKMERFWRHLREACLDHLGTVTTLHEVQARLLAFLDGHYHQTPHGGLFGKSPADVWSTASLRPVEEPALTAALTTHTRRRVRKDGTLDVDGQTWQLDQSFLAGAVVTVAVDLTSTAAPVVEHDKRRYVLRPVDPVAAGKMRRKRPVPERSATIPFDPPGALLDRVVGRPPRHRRPEED
jgi:putative transposase